MSNSWIPFLLVFTIECPPNSPDMESSLALDGDISGHYTRHVEAMGFFLLLNMSHCSVGGIIAGFHWIPSKELDSHWPDPNALQPMRTQCDYLLLTVGQWESGQPLYSSSMTVMLSDLRKIAMSWLNNLLFWDWGLWSNSTKGASGLNTKHKVHSQARFISVAWIIIFPIRTKRGYFVSSSLCYFRRSIYACSLTPLI